MTVPTVDALLASTAIGNGWHDWPIEGGSIRVETAALRIALERAYDPSMPNWASVINEDDIEAAWRCSPAWIGKTDAEKLDDA